MRRSYTSEDICLARQASLIAGVSDTHLNKFCVRPCWKDIVVLKLRADLGQVQLIHLHLTGKNLA